MKKNIITILTLTSALLLTACGSAKYEATANGAYSSKASSDMYMYADSAAEYEEAAMEAPAEGGSVTVQDTSRKLIKNVDLTVETDNLDTMLANLEGRINEYNGYIEYSYINNDGSYSYSKNASLNVRIPAVKLDEFLNTIGEISNVLNKSVNVTDITLQYVDTEARKDSLKTQEKRLLELMEEAETIEDIIAIEERLSNVQYELESAERQMRTYDNQVDYSTVYININEVKEFTPVEEQSRWEWMSEGFVENISAAFNGLLDFFAGLIVILPFLVLWGIFIAIVIWLLIKLIKWRKKGKEARTIKKKEKKALKEQKKQEKLSNE